MSEPLLAPRGLSFADAIARLDLGDAEGGIASAIETAEEVSGQISDAIYDARREVLNAVVMAVKDVAASKLNNQPEGCGNA